MLRRDLSLFFAPGAEKDDLGKTRKREKRNDARELENGHPLESWTSQRGVENIPFLTSPASPGVAREARNRASARSLPFFLSRRAARAPERRRGVFCTTL